MAKRKVEYLGGGAYAGIVNMDKGFVITSQVEDAAAPATKQPKINDDIEGTTDKWVNWGTDNLWPTRVRKLMESSTVAAPLIYKAVCQMYGTGLVYWQNVRDENGVKKDFSTIPEVEEFLENNPVDYISLERMMDYKYFNNIFQEFIFNSSETNKKIIETHHLEAEFCRLSEQDSTSNEFKKIGFYGDWENLEAKNVTSITNVPWLRRSQAEILDADTKKFAVHSKFPSPGRSIYGAPPHQALYNKDGWLVYSNQIPKILNAVLKNGMNIKYHIKIPSTYWRAVFPKWDQFNEKQQREKKKEKLEEMNDWLTGVNGSMKSFISEYATDKVTGKALPGWEIAEIKDSSNFDKELLTSQESDAHISRALGIDPSLSGLQPQGGKMGAGSGSDKRTAFQNAVSMTPAEQLVVLDFLYVIGKTNGWPSNLRWGFNHQIPTTLNENKSGQTETT